MPKLPQSEVPPPELGRGHIPSCPGLLLPPRGLAGISNRGKLPWEENAPSSPLRNVQCHWRKLWKALAATGEAPGGSGRGPRRQGGTGETRGMSCPLAGPATGLPDRVHGGKGRWQERRRDGASQNTLPRCVILARGPCLPGPQSPQMYNDRIGLRSLPVRTFCTFCTFSSSKLGACKPALIIGSFHVVFLEDNNVSVDTSRPTLAEASALFVDQLGTL